MKTKEIFTNHLTRITFTNGNDQRNGTASAEHLDGLGGNDTILGLSGNDTLLGSAGLDSLDGGTGNDSLFGGTGNDVLSGNTGNDQLFGDDGNDTLNGSAGADTLLGGVGADLMLGGMGNDRYQVDNFSDQVEEDTGSAGGTDTVDSLVNFTLGPALENLLLTGEQDLTAIGNELDNRLTGNNGNNLLLGNSGRDSLQGGRGDDTLDGGIGVDRLLGGDGSDIYVLNNNEDRIIETATDGDMDAVQSSISYTLIANLEVLTLTGALDINATGNRLNNRLQGNSGANELLGGKGDDTLHGDAGDDLLDGYVGNDSLDGGDGNDTARYAGNKAHYNLAYDPDNNIWTIEDNHAIDQLVNIETARFADQDVDISHPPKVVFSVGNVTQREGSGSNGFLPFIVKLSQAAVAPITVNYLTQDGTALAGQDYTSTFGAITFATGEMQKTITVPVIGDTMVEDEETFSLLLKAADLTTTEPASVLAVATLTNDDQPIITIAEMSQLEGNSGTRNVTLTVTLSAAYTQTVTVNYITADSTAIAGSDYNPTNGTLIFAAGETSKNLSVALKGDTTVENDEIFLVRLSSPNNATLGFATATATITNDDIPMISMASTALTEGNSGSRNAILTATLSQASNRAVTVNYATNNGTAIMELDYVATSGMLTFAVGETSKTITVPVLGDTTIENNETFQVQLSSATNATINGSAGAGIVTLTNDDFPLISIANITMTEGNSDTVNADLTLTLSAALSQIVTVNYATVDGTATATDYTASMGKVIFNAGETSRIISIPVHGEISVENDETFQVVLSAPSNATLDATASTATVTIKNDDAPIPIEQMGTEGSDTLTGDAGNDTLNGVDGDDVLTGNAGVDILTGGAGNDSFVFAANASGVDEGNRDLVTDFAQGLDILDFALFAGLNFIGGEAFTGSNQIRYEFDASTENTIIQINTNMDTTADFEIQLTGIFLLSAEDFNL